LENFSGRDCLIDLGVGVRIVLEWMLEKGGMRVWTDCTSGSGSVEVMVKLLMKFVFCSGRGFPVCVTVGLKKYSIPWKFFGRSFGSLEDVPIFRMILIVT
jgi:hypothetical protein